MLSPTQVKTRIDSILQRYQPSAIALSLVPQTLTAGKLYEAWVLCDVLERLRADEGYTIRLLRSTKVTLKSSPGPINRAYPYFELTAGNLGTLELWTDVEFMTLSHSRRMSLSSPMPGDYHELDIVVVEAGTSGRPRHDAVLLAIECKNTGYTKDLLRAILGIRRELSLLSDPRTTRFQSWPRSAVPADPASCVLVYSTDPSVLAYSGPGVTFGIDFFHEPLP